MQRLSRYISSLLLLVVISISALPVLSFHLHCHCSSHCTNHITTEESEAEHHHHCTTDDECTNHRSHLDYQCVATNTQDTSREYIVTPQLRPQSITAVTLLYTAIVSAELFDEIVSEKFDEWRNYDLYRGFDPICSLLRAPPALC